MGVGMGHIRAKGLTLPLICHVVAWVQKNALPPLTSCHLGEMEELALEARKWENQSHSSASALWRAAWHHCTSPGKHTKANPVGGGTSELSL